MAITNMFMSIPDDDVMDFSDALRYLKRGKKVARTGWNGKGMYLEYTACCHSVGEDYHAYVTLFTAQQYFVPWVASHTDLLADDWVVVG